MSRIGALACAAIALLAPSTTEAQGTAAPTSPEIEVCFSAAERAQPLMKQKRLREARAELEVCARDLCPRAARNDCREWLADVTRREPTIILAPHERSAGGTVRDAERVRAVIDGAIVIDDLDGTPIAINPGPHKVHLEHPGAHAIDQTIDVQEGEKTRVIDVYFAVPDPPRPSRPVPPLVFALGGLGVVGVGVGTYFEASGLSKRSDLDASCKTTRSCTQTEVDSARGTMRTGDIAIGVGALFLAGATFLFVTRPEVAPKSETSPNSARIGWLLGPTMGGAFVGAYGSL